MAGSNAGTVLYAARCHDLPMDRAKGDWAVAPGSGIVRIISDMTEGCHRPAIDPAARVSLLIDGRSLLGNGSQELSGAGLDRGFLVHNGGRTIESPALDDAAATGGGTMAKGGSAGRTVAILGTIANQAGAGGRAHPVITGLGTVVLGQKNPFSATASRYSGGTVLSGAGGPLVTTVAAFAVSPGATSANFTRTHDATLTVLSGGRAIDSLNSGGTVLPQGATELVVVSGQGGEVATSSEPVPLAGTFQAAAEE